MSSSDAPRPAEVYLELPMPRPGNQKRLTEMRDPSQTTVAIRANVIFRLDNQFRAEAALAHAVATLAPRPCEHCSLGLRKEAPFVDCKVLDGYFKGACTNCRADQEYHFCTFTTSGIITESTINRRYNARLRARAIEMVPALQNQWRTNVPEGTRPQTIIFAEEILRRFDLKDKVARAYFTQPRERIELKPVIGPQSLFLASIREGVSILNKYRTYAGDSPEMTIYRHAAEYPSQAMNVVVAERRQTWDVCRTHPFFLYLLPEKQEKVKEAVRDFFDKRYTSFIAEITRGIIPLRMVAYERMVRMSKEDRVLYVKDEGDFAYVAEMLEEMNQELGPEEERWTLERNNALIWEQLLDQGHEIVKLMEVMNGVQGMNEISVYQMTELYESDAMDESDATNESDEIDE